MATRIPWDKHEVALLFDSYERIAGGIPFNSEADRLSKLLRGLAIRRGLSIDKEFRNTNGMKMQFANLQYLFTDGKTGLSGASNMMRQMYNIYKNNPSQYQAILKEAFQLSGVTISVEDAFFTYAKGKTNLSSEKLSECLKKAADYCHLSQPLLGMTDISAVRSIQQRVATGNLLRFRFGKETQNIRNATQLYYRFVKSYREEKAFKLSQDSNLRERVTPALSLADDERITPGNILIKTPEKLLPDSSNEFAGKDKKELDEIELTEGQFWIDFTQDKDYSYTQPVFFIYKGNTHESKKWSKLYIELCWLLLEDYREKFMGLINRDVPGCGALSFADENHKAYMRKPQSFASEYYVETNISSSYIIRRIRGMYLLFQLCDNLKIAFQTTANGSSAELATENDRTNTIEKHTDISGVHTFLNKDFENFLVSVKHLSNHTAVQYCRAIVIIEDFIKEKNINGTLNTLHGDEVENLAKALMKRNDFSLWNKQVHHQYSAALSQYIDFLHKGAITSKDNQAAKNDVVIKPDNIKWRSDTGRPLTIFNAMQKSVSLVQSADERWLPILRESFPDGYILDDFLSQFQASSCWRERYGNNCPLEGEEIDQAIKSIGTVRDGRVFEKSERDNKLILQICTEINHILSQYTCAFRDCIYERYREELAKSAIYTEEVMTQQLQNVAKGSFHTYYQFYVRPERDCSIENDCIKVMRDHGGPMSVDDVSNVLWFMPRGIVYNNLCSCGETLNIDTGVWMLVEHFPLTPDDASKVGDVLDEYFLKQEYIKQTDMMQLLRDELPSIADNLSALHSNAIFNILNHYLSNRFSFSKSIIAPMGAKKDIRDLFQKFAQEHDSFSLDELSSFASELKVPIYWESTFRGGAVRISSTEFVDRRHVSFDNGTTDKVLEELCPDDYLPLYDISPAVMLHLPPCGYQWNGYLLLSYIYSFSKEFKLIYNSLGKTGYYGAMVRISCAQIDNYDRLVERILTDNNNWNSDDDALNLLVKTGLQGRRRLSGIEKITEKARQNKILKTSSNGV